MKDRKHQQGKSSCGAVYGLGMIGALVYFFQQSSTLAEGLLAIIKAILWPAFVIYEVLGNLGL